VVVAGAAGTAWILDAETGDRIGELELPGGLLKAVVSPNAQHVAAWGPWDTRCGAARTAGCGR
jgi:MOSC domain-containing protein YiiM